MHATSDARISPVFRYNDAPHAIEWLSRAYGFVNHEVHQRPDGTIAHAELRLGPAAIGLGSASPSHQANPWTAVRQGVYVFTSRVDDVFRGATAAGALIVQPLDDTDYGARQFSARDIGGHLWSFGTHGMGAPEGKPSLFVGLHYFDGYAAVQWLETAFGFTRVLEVPGEHGAVARAELRLGRDYIVVSSGFRDQAHWGPHHQSTHVWVDDVEEHHSRAVHAQATIVQEPRDTHHGWCEYYSRDPEGFLWSFGTYRPEGA